MYLLCVCMHAYIRVCAYIHMFNYTNIYVHMHIQLCTAARVWGAEDNLKSVLSFYGAGLFCGSVSGYQA